MKKLFISMLSVLSVATVWAADVVDLSSAEKVAEQSFFTVTDPKINYNTKYACRYGEVAFSAGLKMQSATTITFTTTTASTLTVVQAIGANSGNYIKVTSTLADESKETFTGSASNRSDNATDKSGVYVISLKAGSHSIARAGSECGLAYLSCEAQDANKCVNPVVAYAEGATFGSASTVTLSSGTDGASIYYTLDGTVPTASSTLYAAPFTVEQACTVKAIAVKDGLSNSEVVEKAVTINSKRNVSFNFEGITLTQGTAIAATAVEDGADYVLPSGRLYYVEGQTQTGWNDGTSVYALGDKVKADKDYTFAPVFAANTVALGDAEATVDWTFALDNGAPAIAIEGKDGYYAAQTKVGTTALDVVMKIDATTGVAFADVRGKCNNTSKTNCAQVNKGTVFTIPAVKGMVVTYTATNNGTLNTTSATFGGEEGTVEGSSLVYTYEGEEATLTIVDCGANLYPSGIKVVYPVKDNATGIKQVAAKGNKSGKMIQNGKLVIVSNGRQYNAAGVMIK